MQITDSHRHTPSSRKSDMGIFLDYVLHSKRLYQRKSGPAVCARCGAVIKRPPQYGKKMPLFAVNISGGTTILVFVIIKLLRIYTQWSSWLILFISVLLWFCLLFLNFRIHQAIVLKKHGWAAIDYFYESDRINIMTEAEEVDSQVSWGIYYGLLLVLLTIFIFSKFLIYPVQ